MLLSLGREIWSSQAFQNLNCDQNSVRRFFRVVHEIHWLEYDLILELAQGQPVQGALDSCPILHLKKVDSQQCIEYNREGRWFRGQEAGIWYREGGCFLPLSCRLRE